MIFLIKDISFNYRPDGEKDPFLRSFSDVADSVQVLPVENEGEDLESPLRHPEYMVLVHRIVANLQAPTPRHSPMVTIELFVEASNQETAIEIHEREPEVRDLIERTLEQTTFDELDTQQGKVRLKIKLRASFNHILNKGEVRRIFFKGLNIHK